MNSLRMRGKRLFIASKQTTYASGRLYEDILEEVEAQLMKVVDRTPQFNIGELTD